MNADIANALAIGPSPTTPQRTVDITTMGARSGQPRRNEIWFWQVDGRWYLSSDRPRDWAANLRANPAFTLHLKHGVRADLAAKATPVTDETRRRHILREILVQDGRRNPEDVLDAWVAQSPLFQIEFQI
jgi:deazaflavin-dependent oxidoreductase (nitroreductase family)